MRFTLVHSACAALWLCASSLAFGQTETAPATTALPDDVPGLRQAANEAYSTQDYRRFRKAMLSLHRLRPNNSEYMYQLVLAHALLDDKSKAYTIMLSMQKQGLFYDFTSTEDSINIRDTEVFEYINDLLVRAGQPYGEAEPLFSLPEDLVLPETIEWDSANQRYLVGSIREGLVLEVKADGSSRELLRANEKNGLWAIFDLVADSKRDRLWVSSAASRYFSGFNEPDRGRSALFEFDLESMELVGRYPVPVDGRPHQLGNMVLAPNGDIYLADGLLPFIYRKPAGEDRLETFMAVKNMVSLRGMAISDDGQMLYVADYEMGILGVDLVKREAGMLTGPETLNLGGIDGLSIWKGFLIVIQNGISPQRVMRLELGEDRFSVSAVRPLAVSQPLFDFPNYGVVNGDDLVYFGNSHWASAPGERRAVQVLRTGLETGEDTYDLELQKYLDESKAIRKDVP